MSKEEYQDIVRATIRYMLQTGEELSDPTYFPADLQHYYTNRIQKDHILSEVEFMQIVSEEIKKRSIHK